MSETIFRSVVEEADRAENRAFYAPAFQVRINGENLPQNVLRDVIELKYIDGLTEIDRFELSLNNWDPIAGGFKFIGSEAADYMTSGDEKTRLFRLFQPCKKDVEIALGYADNLLTMMLGNFTTMEPSFPSSGAPTLTVTGLNVLHQLRSKPFTTSWVKQKPSAIARNIATLNDKGKARFPLPIVVDATAEEGEPTLDYTAQTNQFDIDFLLNLARRHGYELVVQEANKKAGTPKRLYFGPGRNARPPVNYRLAWGRTLVEFHPTLTSYNQVKSVTVNGWDRSGKKPIKETVKFDDPEVKDLNADLREYIQCDPREELVVERPVFTREEAKNLAKAILTDRTSSVIKARGTAIGLPELRAGTKVHIGELGARLSGEYLVTKTEHSFTDAGYTVKFEARREQLKGAAA